MSEPYNIPKNLLNPLVENRNQFILLNNEFRENTSLYGFDIYGASSGKIQIQVSVQLLNNKKRCLKFKHKKDCFF